MEMASSVMDDTSICNLVKIAPHSYVEHFADKSNVWKNFTSIPDDPPPPDVRIRTSHSGKMNFEREFSVHDFYFSL